MKRRAWLHFLDLTKAEQLQIRDHLANEWPAFDCPRTAAESDERVEIIRRLMQPKGDTLSVCLNRIFRRG